MDPIFRKTEITCIRGLLGELRPVRFPESTHLSAVEVITLKRDIRRNCEVLISYVYAQLRSGPVLPADLVIGLKQLLRDAHATRSECAKVTVTFLRPKHKRIITKVRSAYEEMRTAAIVVCQHSEPAMMDSLTITL